MACTQNAVRAGTRIVIALAGLLSGLSSSAQQAPPPLNAQESCRAAVAAMDKTTSVSDRDFYHCLGFILGTTRTLELVEPYLPKPLACVPDSASNGQLMRVFVNYINRHPEKLHQGASLLVALSLQEAFPCKKAD